MWSALAIFPPLVIPAFFIHRNIVYNLKNTRLENALRGAAQMKKLLHVGLRIAVVFYVLIAFFVFVKGGELIPAMGSFY